MTKTFCDICKMLIINDKDEVRIGAYGRFTSMLICISCYRKRSNWKIIQNITLNLELKNPLRKK